MSPMLFHPSPMDQGLTPFHLQLIHPATLHKINASLCPNENYHVQGTAMMVFVYSRLGQDPRCECCRTHIRDMNTFGAKWGNNPRIKIYHRLFGVWENLRIALSSAYEMSPKNTIFSIWEEVGLTNKVADRSMNSSLSSKQTIVGWPTAGSCHPILVFRSDFLQTLKYMMKIIDWLLTESMNTSAS